MSCNKENEKQFENKLEKVKSVPVKLTNLEVKIEGMTCEIGCARLIQSKLYKTGGVKFALVSFEEAKGEITFDANQITDADIKMVIEKIAGGDLYKVIQMNEVLEFSKEANKVAM